MAYSKKEERFFPPYRPSGPHQYQQNCIHSRCYSRGVRHLDLIVANRLKVRFFRRQRGPIRCRHRNLRQPRTRHLPAQTRRFLYICLEYYVVQPCSRGLYAALKCSRSPMEELALFRTKSPVPSSEKMANHLPDLGRQHRQRRPCPISRVAAARGVCCSRCSCLGRHCRNSCRGP